MVWPVESKGKQENINPVSVMPDLLKHQAFTRHLSTEGGLRFKSEDLTQTYK